MSQDDGRAVIGTSLVGCPHWCSHRGSWLGVCMTCGCPTSTVMGAPLWPRRLSALGILARRALAARSPQLKTNTAKASCRSAGAAGSTHAIRSVSAIARITSHDHQAHRPADPGAAVVTTGSPAVHAIITPACRSGRGDEGAWDEAVARAKEQYDAIVAGWRESAHQPTLHLVLGVERPFVPFGDQVEIRSCRHGSPAVGAHLNCGNSDDPA